MTPHFRQEALSKYITTYLDWLLVTVEDRAEHEAPYDESYDHVGESLAEEVRTLRDYADAIERHRLKRVERRAAEARLAALRNVTEANGYSAGEVVNARAALERIGARS